MIWRTDSPETTYLPSLGWLSVQWKMDTCLGLSAVADRSLVFVHDVADFAVVAVAVIVVESSGVRFNSCCHCLSF